MQEKVLVAMSGGVDSSIAAILLKKKGYEVIGVTLKTWHCGSSSNPNQMPKYINSAQSIAEAIGIQHVVMDVIKDFDTKIIVNFYDEYLAGRTPNPCVNCNRQIKWTALLSRLDEFECKKIATGHYAKVRFENNRYVLSKGRDLSKDQSYVLSALTQEQLSKTIFPLGELYKTEVKALAGEYGLPKLTEQSESYELCFIPNNDYREFLSNKNPNLKELKNGKIILESGKCVGYHEGYPFYTVGQRKGLNIALGYPAYVLEIRAQKNEIVVGRKESLYKNELLVKGFNVIKYDRLPLNRTLVTKIRYNDAGALSILEGREALLAVSSQEKLQAVTPGQIAVFYEENDVLGCGYII